MKKKRFFLPVNRWEAGVVESWLEHQAQKGWVPVSFGNWFATFEESEPKALRFRLEPKRKENWEALQERENAYRDMGWRRAGTLDDWEVFWCADPAAPELYTDPETQALAWERQFRRQRRIAWLYFALFVLWVGVVLWTQARETMPVRALIYGFGPYQVGIFLFLLDGLVLQLFRLRDIRRTRQQLAAGVSPGPGGNWQRGRRWTKVLFWGYVIFVAAVILYPIWRVQASWGGAIEELDRPLPYVSLEQLGSDVPVSSNDSRRCLVNVSILAHAYYQLWEDTAAGLWVTVRYDQLRLERLAEPLYEESLIAYQKGHPTAVMEELTDPRFDRAVLLTSPNANGTGEIQCFIACRGKAVILESCYAPGGDLRDHLDDFAAILEEFP